MGPMKTLERSSGLTCCVTSETYKRTFGLCHMEFEHHTDVRDCDNDVFPSEKDIWTYGIRRKMDRRLPFVTVRDKIMLRVPECNLGNELLKVVRVIDLLIEITR